MLKSIYSVIMTDKIEESRLFFETYFGFTESFSSDWYISLIHPDGGELAFIDVKHETIPNIYRSSVKGMIINIEVENATQVYEDVKRKNESIIVMHLRDEEYGQRHFMVQDTNDILVDVIEVIPPSEEFQKNYADGGM